MMHDGSRIEGIEMPAIFTDEEREALRRTMLDAGWRCLLERGYRATRVEDVAREAGIAPGTFYGFFKSKSEFVAEMVAENRRALMEELHDMTVRAKRSGGAPGRDELDAWMRAAWHSDRAIFRCVDDADFRKIRRALPGDVSMGPELAGGMLASVAEAVRAAGGEPDAELAASLQRVCALTLLARDEFAPAALERTVDALIDATLDALYGRSGSCDERVDGDE